MFPIEGVGAENRASYSRMQLRQECMRGAGEVSTCGRSDGKAVRAVQ